MDVFVFIKMFQFIITYILFIIAIIVCIFRKFYIKFLNVFLLIQYENTPQKSD